MGYAFFLAREFRPGAAERFAALVEYSMQHVDAGYDGAEAAMLLDMLLAANFP